MVWLIFCLVGCVFFVLGVVFFVCLFGFVVGGFLFCCFGSCVVSFHPSLPSYKRYEAHVGLSEMGTGP